MMGPLVQEVEYRRERAPVSQGVMWARARTKLAMKAERSGQGKSGSALQMVTVPCMATQTAVASISGSVLEERPPRCNRQWSR